MAINKITPPTGGAALTVADYNAQNNLLMGLLKLATNGQRFLTEWETVTKPDIPNGTIIHHGGALFLADSDTAIIGSPVDGPVWVKVSGVDTLTAEFITSLTGYSWDTVHNGFYEIGGAQALPVKMEKSGTDYKEKRVIDLKVNTSLELFTDGKRGNANTTATVTSTENTLFDELVDLVPVIGDTYRNISGAVSASSLNLVISVEYIERLDASTIRITGFKDSSGTASAGIYDIQNGDSTAIIARVIWG